MRKNHAFSKLSPKAQIFATKRENYNTKGYIKQKIAKMKKTNKRQNAWNLA